MGILEGLNPARNLEPCKIGKIIIDLAPEDRTILVDALLDDRWNARSLAKALNARGIPLATDTVRAHMNKSCRCSRI